MNRFIYMAIALSGLAGVAPAHAADWVPTQMPWTSLPGGTALGAAPQTIAIPPEAYGYGGRSDAVEVFGKTQPAILKLTLRVNTGSAGVLLVTPDGSRQISKEKTLSVTGADVDVYFRIRPATPPAMVILRNYNAPGQAGSVTIRSTAFIREGDLTNEELAALVAKGLH